MAVEASRRMDALGLYGIPEAARLLGSAPPFTNGRTVAPPQLSRWIRSNLPPEEPAVPSARRMITFKDLISSRMVAILHSRGVRFHEIQDTERWVRDNLDIDWPFVSRPLWTYASEVYSDFEQHLLVVSRFGQHAMEFLRGWLTEIDLDMDFDEDNLVSSWTPFERVTIDPTIQLGQPCISGTRIPTSTIWGNLRAGDSFEVVARLYDLAPEQIDAAVRWELRVAPG